MSSILAEDEGKYNRRINRVPKNPLKGQPIHFWYRKDPGRKKQKQKNKKTSNYITKTLVELIEKFPVVWYDGNEFL